ncbi:MAG: hypothetical protein IPH06_08705 [Alphaproteobacteria bacterium]|nr:hypothetical protein [Alphaproteobacteria bacterium]QQS58080.1 MAG: hypothetical protein IPN28_04465 [Alphaproteobacteria bacterium]
MGRGFFEDLRSIFIDDYKDAVRETSTVPTVFMDPDKFNRDHFNSTGTVHPDDVKKMREMLERQLPGITNGVTDASLQQAVALSLTRGPFAARGEVAPPAGSTAAPLPVCIVNERGSLLDHKNTFQPLVSAQDLQRIREIPGWTDHWDRMWGVHEGTHCNQPAVNTSGMTPDQEAVTILRDETQADQAAVDWARRNGLNDIAQAFIDHRALGAAFDHEHATAILMDKPGPVTIDHINAARTFRSEMISKVATDQGLSQVDAEAMLNDRPEEFNGHLKRLLGNGAFDGNTNPHVKESIEAFSGAVDRQITERRIERELEQQRRLNGHDRHGAATDPVTGREDVRVASGENVSDPKSDAFAVANYNGTDAIVMPSAYADMDVSTVSGGAPVVALNDGDKASMTIGGVSASAFFASHADNDLAQQRIALEQESGVGLERDFQRSSPAVGSYGMA